MYVFVLSQFSPINNHATGEKIYSQRKLDLVYTNCDVNKRYSVYSTYIVDFRVIASDITLPISYKFGVIFTLYYLTR